MRTRSLAQRFNPINRGHRTGLRALLALVGLMLTMTGLPVVHAAPVNLVDGKNYRSVITDVTPPKDGKVLVQEFFWYGCPHCFHLEPAIEPWIRQLPDSVRFQRVALPLGPNWVPLSRAFYAAKYMGVLQQTHTKVFDAIHIKHIRPVNKAQIADLYADLGVNRDKFLKMYDSFAVDNAVRKAEAIGEQAGITGVPSILVDGKYLTTGKMAGSNKAMLAIVDALIAKIRQKEGDHASQAGQDHDGS